MSDYAKLRVRYEDPVRRRSEVGWVEAMPGDSEYGTSMLQLALVERGTKRFGRVVLEAFAARWT